MLDEVVILSRLVHYVALCYLAGGALFRLAVAPIHTASGDRTVALIAVASALGWFAGVAAQMAGGWQELTADTLAAVLMETHFGWLWCVRLALLIGLPGMTLIRPAAASMTAEITRSCSGCESVGDSPVVPTGHTLVVPAAT